MFQMWGGTKSQQELDESSVPLRTPTINNYVYIPYDCSSLGMKLTLWGYKYKRLRTCKMKQTFRKNCQFTGQCISHHPLDNKKAYKIK